MSNTNDTPMDYKRLERHTPIPQWVIDYNNAGHQSSAGRAVGILIKEIESLKLDLQKQKEEIEQLRAVIEKLLPLADGYCTYLSGVLDYIPNDSDGKFELENSRSLIDETKKLIKP